MNAKHYQWVILPLVVGAGAFDWFGHTPFMLGFSTEESSTDGYRIAGGTAPWALETSALFLLVYLLLMFARKAEPDEQIVGWWRRFAAFWLDFIYGMMILAPVLGLVPVYMEWKRTGMFEWAFERNTYESGDGLMQAGVAVLAILTVLFYFTFPLVRGRPSPGACVMGYQIAKSNGAGIGVAVALKRAVAGFTFLGDRKRPIPRIDGWFGTRAVRLK